MQPLFLDIMDGTRFLCQLRCTLPPRKTISGGRVIPSLDAQNLRQWVIHQRPSLAARDFTIRFSDQRIPNP